MKKLILILTTLLIFLPQAQGLTGVFKFNEGDKVLCKSEKDKSYRTLFFGKILGIYGNDLHVEVNKFFKRDLDRMISSEGQSITKMERVFNKNLCRKKGQKGNNNVKK